MGYSYHSSALQLFWEQEAVFEEMERRRLNKGITLSSDPGVFDT